MTCFRPLALTLSFISLISCTSDPQISAPSDSTAVAKTGTLPKTLQEAVQSTTYRLEKHSKRDTYRHPIETLNFFGLKPNMSVLEISPGEGWYAQILAPYLSNEGSYTAGMQKDMGIDAYKERNKVLLSWGQEHPEVKLQTVGFKAGDKIESDPKFDMVLTFRNVHNWMPNGNAEAAFAAFFEVLKPGGILGVVEHRQSSKVPQDPKGKGGYVREDVVIKMAEKAGFKLEAKSEINANPKDTKDYEKGVWTLPPTLTLKDVDKDKYLAIGESDRMTLRFIKPAAKL